MKVIEVYLKTDLTLDELAWKLRVIFNIPETNKSIYHVEQRRQGSNRGGDYYFFEVFGLTLELLNNTGEMEIPERSDWQYYLLVYSEEVDLDENNLTILANHICKVVRKAGIEAEIDSLCV